MEEDKWPSPEIKDCYLKNIFANIFLSDTSFNSISDMGVTDHRRYDP